MSDIMTTTTVDEGDSKLLSFAANADGEIVDFVQVLEDEESLTDEQ